MNLFQLKCDKIDSIEVTQIYMYDESGNPIRGVNLEYLKTYMKRHNDLLVSSLKDNIMLINMYTWLQENYPELLL